MSRFRVLLGTMEQRQRVARDIMFVCGVLHNMLIHQGYFNHAGAMVGQEDRIRDVSTKNPGGRS